MALRERFRPCENAEERHAWAGLQGLTKAHPRLTKGAPVFPTDWDVCATAPAARRACNHQRLTFKWWPGGNFCMAPASTALVGAFYAGFLPTVVGHGRGRLVFAPRQPVARFKRTGPLLRVLPESGRIGATRPCPTARANLSLLRDAQGASAGGPRMVKAQGAGTADPVGDRNCVPRPFRLPVFRRRFCRRLRRSWSCAPSRAAKSLSTIDVPALLSEPRPAGLCRSPALRQHPVGGLEPLSLGSH